MVILASVHSRSLVLGIVVLGLVILEMVVLGLVQVTALKTCLGLCLGHQGNKLDGRWAAHLDRARIQLGEAFSAVAAPDRIQDHFSCQCGYSYCLKQQIEPWCCWHI
jgi:hypothetical protein